MKRISLIVFTLFLSHVGLGATESATPSTAESAQVRKVKYKASKDMNFEELLIEGQLKRPDLSVVTGDTESGNNGLLRLRKDFIDRMAADSGEEAQ